MAVDIETMNRWLQNHKSHNILFGTWHPEEHWQDATGFPLPDAARLPSVVLSIRCDDCHTGVKIAEAG